MTPRRTVPLLILGLLALLAGTSCTPSIDDAPATTSAGATTGGTTGGIAAGTTVPGGFVLDDADRRGEPLRVAVVTGGHAFDVVHFYQLFRRLPGVDAYPQHLEHFASSPDEVRDAYDAVVFYGMEQKAPTDDAPHYAGEPRTAIERLVDRGQGIVVLHHALLAWEEWGLWNRLIGVDNRNFRYKEGLDLTIEVADADHPITDGMADFRIHDEGYVLKGDYDGRGAVLLTTRHPDAMKQVAWARTYGSCNVFCLALGHDDQAWTNPGFEDLLARGIAWAAGK